MFKYVTNCLTKNTYDSLGTVLTCISKSNVYGICKKCHATYVRETSQQLADRLTEHIHSIRYILGTQFPTTFQSTIDLPTKRKILLLELSSEKSTNQNLSNIQHYTRPLTNQNQSLDFSFGFVSILNLMLLPSQ